MYLSGGYNSIIDANFSLNTSDWGGALYLNDSNLTLSNSILPEIVQLLTPLVHFA